MQNQLKICGALFCLLLSCNPKPKKPASSKVKRTTSSESFKEVRGRDFDLTHVNLHDTLSMYAKFNDKSPDSINILKAQQLVWRLREVRESALYFRKKNVYAFTMLDQEPTKDCKCYVIGFYQLLKVFMPHMHTYRVFLKTGNIEAYDIVKDRWEKRNGQVPKKV